MTPEELAERLAALLPRPRSARSVRSYPFALSLPKDRPPAP